MEDHPGDPYYQKSFGNIALRKRLKCEFSSKTLQYLNGESMFCDCLESWYMRWQEHPEHTQYYAFYWEV